MKDKEISHGSMQELLSYQARREGCPPMDLKALNDAIEKVDPGGKKAHQLAEKYYPESVRDFFLKACREGKFGEPLQDAIASMPKLGPVNLLEKVRLLVGRAIQYAQMDLDEKRALYKTGDWPIDLK